jgi:PilZ domain-containing protein
MEERRRSQRVMIQVPVTVMLTAGGEKKSFPAHTVSVNIHGAMILCKRSIDAETMVEVVNDRTRQRITARVTRAPREGPGGHLIPVEFEQSNPNFWQISFPPDNWKSVEG